MKWNFLWYNVHAKSEFGLTESQGIRTSQVLFNLYVGQGTLKMLFPLLCMCACVCACTWVCGCVV